MACTPPRECVFTGAAAICACALTRCVSTLLVTEIEVDSAGRAIEEFGGRGGGWRDDDELETSIGAGEEGRRCGRSG
jgi:hypothetical protein